MSGSLVTWENWFVDFRRWILSSWFVGIRCWILSSWFVDFRPGILSSWFKCNDFHTVHCRDLCLRVLIRWAETRENRFHFPVDWLLGVVGHVCESYDRILGLGALSESKEWRWRLKCVEFWWVESWLLRSCHWHEVELVFLKILLENVWICETGPLSSFNFKTYAQDYRSFSSWSI